ncbi:MAG TPA: phosphopyruvate hydratase [Candidatus Saccharimonadales bacterium]|nr:phosphopyruvate hydratase [Candidatus Saccharimonadales bacterium]
MTIASISARQVYDSRGFPTVECDVVLDDGSLGRAIVPSGASTGSGEALELRDGGKDYGGKGVTHAIANVIDIIAPAIKGRDASDQKAIDQTIIELDGTENKSKLGENATLAVSLATAKAAATSAKQPLYAYFGSLINNTEFTIPMPQLNILNGGKHAHGSTDVQEFMIIPIGAQDISTGLRMASEIYHRLGTVLSDAGYATSVGDEGGYAPSVKNGTEEALQLLNKAVETAGYVPGKDVAYALDIAASELVGEYGYNFARANKQYNSDELIGMYDHLVHSFPIVSIEDGLGENDWASWKKLNEHLGQQIQLVGDDLIATHTSLLKRAIDEKSANAILIKPNQIGTLSETIDALTMAKQAGWRTVISHRSGETEDTTIAHLAVGLNAGQIKAGSFARSERIAKYNELIRIAEQLHNSQLSHPFTVLS